LAHYVDYLSANGLDTRSYELAFWLKVLSPFTNMALLFVAMPFVFGTHRSASAGQRIVIGIFLGLLFFLMNRMLGNLVLLYGYHPIIGASLPTVAFFLGGAVALSRAR
jgi:lipopolysaccharide export system permease protein